MISAKLGTLGFLKIKTISNESYDIIISVNDVTNKILSPESNNRCGNSSISMNEVIITSIL